MTLCLGLIDISCWHASLRIYSRVGWEITLTVAQVLKKYRALDKLGLRLSWGLSLASIVQYGPNSSLCFYCILCIFANGLSERQLSSDKSSMWSTVYCNVQWTMRLHRPKVLRFFIFHVWVKWLRSGLCKPTKPQDQIQQPSCVHWNVLILKVIKYDCLFKLRKR